LTRNRPGDKQPVIALHLPVGDGHAAHLVRFLQPVREQTELPLGSKSSGP
jgi:hypothetical protein